MTAVSRCISVYQYTLLGDVIRDNPWVVQAEMDVVSGWKEDCVSLRCE